MYYEKIKVIRIVLIHALYTDNELIKYQMAFGSHFVTIMHIFVTLCPVYESLVVICFLCYTHKVCSNGAVFLF